MDVHTHVHRSHTGGEVSYMSVRVEKKMVCLQARWQDRWYTVYMVTLVYIPTGSGECEVCGVDKYLCTCEFFDTNTNTR